MNSKMSVNTIGKWLKTILGSSGIFAALGLFFLTDAQITEILAYIGSGFLILDSIINGFQAWDKTRKSKRK